MTKTSESLPRPTESELELLRILWENEPATVRDIYDTLNQERPSGYTTVLKAAADHDRQRPGGAR